ncbi:hypothetical protein F444_17654 [Phytophthora nicotianae P1976]|uniref:Uncharacterized protein n=1 Tax=Phytophthora nicotianae P1976 TaxID=1317066 RepID=A0A080ZE74_PHYNI|nr:hypothetical protein F444_17654 [Phytophthora nicotianae P1976]
MSGAAIEHNIKDILFLSGEADEFRMDGLKCTGCTLWRKIITGAHPGNRDCPEKCVGTVLVHRSHTSMASWADTAYCMHWRRSPTMEIKLLTKRNMVPLGPEV